MANSDKNIVITPNTGEANDPTIILTGGGNVPITIKSLDDSFVQFSLKDPTGPRLILITIYQMAHCLM